MRYTILVTLVLAILMVLIRLAGISENMRVNSKTYEFEMPLPKLPSIEV